MLTDHEYWGYSDVKDGMALTVQQHQASSPLLELAVLFLQECSDLSDLMNCG